MNIRTAGLLAAAFVALAVAVGCGSESPAGSPEDSPDDIEVLPPEEYALLLITDTRISDLADAIQEAREATIDVTEVEPYGPEALRKIDAAWAAWDSVGGDVFNLNYDPSPHLTMVTAAADATMDAIDTWKRALDKLRSVMVTARPLIRAKLAIDQALAAQETAIHAVSAAWEESQRLLCTGVGDTWDEADMACQPSEVFEP